MREIRMRIGNQVPNSPTDSQGARVLASLSPVLLRFVELLRDMPRVRLLS